MRLAALISRRLVRHLRVALLRVVPME